MSKCWYCNEELTTANYCDKHIGICTKCYTSMFKVSNEFVKCLTDKIADLNTKLAESEKQCQQCKHLNKKIELNIKNKLMTELAEKDLEIERLKQDYDEVWEDTYSSVKEDFELNNNCNECRRYYAEEFNKQLAEKDKAIENWRTMYESVIQTCNNDAQEIERLREQLAESDAEIEKVEKTYIKQRDYYTKEFNEVIDNLKQQLAESEEHNKMLLEEKGIHTDLISGYAEKCKNYEKQLKDKEKENDELQDKLHSYYEEVMNKGTCGLCGHLRTEYKTEFAIEKLEEVKNRIQEDFDYDDLMYWLDKQIKELKGEE